jgi:3-oxoadipate enol-lactonase
MPPDLGFTSYGNGPVRVLVLQDWFCDHSSWDAARPYLTPSRFSYIFADLRGYGTSREIEGNYTLEEAAGDAIALADKLGWNRFSLIGHWMSGLIVQRIAQLAPGRISRIVAIAPVPQLNVLSPPNLAPGPVQVKVTSGGVTTAAFTVQAQAESPSFFYL